MAFGGVTMREEAFLFGKTHSLVGIITDPPTLAAGGKPPAVILLNQGLIHRVGSNRLSVRLARRLAGMGFVVLRFDFSGVGDSIARADNLSRQTRWVQETQDAMDYLREAKGIESFILGGVCSGGVASLKIACSDPRVVGALLINPQFFDDELTSYIEARRWRYWKTVLFKPRRWLRPITGRANYRLLRLRLQGWLVSRKRASSIANSMAQDLRSLTERGVNVLLVYSSKDWGLTDFGMMSGAVIDEGMASGKLKVHFVEGADHTFTPVQSQEDLFELVTDWVHAISPARRDIPV